jgi:hypothetical protein
MSVLTPRSLPAVFALSVLVAGCDISVGEHGFSMDVAAGKAQDEWTRTYTVAPGGRLEIVNVNGLINASPAEGGQVEVKAERIAKASNDDEARERLKNIEIVETASADRVRLETKVPKTPWRGGGHEVRYWVKVPKGLAVSFETVNGGVRVENLEGQVAASTTNGGVRGRGLRGAVKAGTTNGGVDIAMAAVTGDIDIETTNGGIQLRLPENAKATVEARCVNGGIRVDEALSVQTVEKTRRLFRGSLNGGGSRVSVDTTNGGIRIAAASAQAEGSDVASTRDKN